MHGKSLGCHVEICWANVLVRSRFKTSRCCTVLVSPKGGMVLFLSLTACRGSFASGVKSAFSQKLTWKTIVGQLLAPLIQCQWLKLTCENILSAPFSNCKELEIPR